MSFSVARGFAKLYLQVIHDVTNKLQHCSRREDQQMRDVQKKSEMFARAYDNLEYEYDADGDGIAEDSSAYRFEKESIAREEDNYDAEVACNNNLIAQDKIALEAELTEAQNALENSDKMAEEATKSFGYMNIS